MRQFYPVLIVFSLLASACKKEKIDLVWEEQISNADYRISDVHFWNENEGVAIGGDSWYFGLELYTQDGGHTWASDSLTGKLLHDLHYSPDSTLFATGIDGYLYSLKPGGNESWQFYRLQTYAELRGSAFFSDGTGILVGGSSYKDGVIVPVRAFNPSDTTLIMSNELNAVAIPDPDGQVAFAVGFGALLKTTDRGFTWSPVSTENDHYRSICFPSPAVGYIVGYSGTILKTTDGGTTWEHLRRGGQALVSDQPFRRVSFLDNELGFISGDAGTLWMTEDGGASWKIFDNLPSYDFFGLHLMENKGWLTGSKGEIIHFLF